MARISAQVILRTADNIPENYCTNTFYFNLDEDSSVGIDRAFLTNEINTALLALYDDVRGLLGGLMQTGHRIKYVDIDEPRPQFPYQEEVWDFVTGIASDVLPHEVCVVSSFEADQVSGVNQASRRGRVFMGPMNAASKATDGRLDDAFRTAMAQAFNDFSDKQDTAGVSGWTWVVYSRKLDTMAQVKMGHVDNAFDTQRKRGVASTVRSVWS